MKLAGFNEECSWLCLFARFHFWKSRNCRNSTKNFFCLRLYFKIRKFIFRQSESCVLTMSSWSRRLKICGLKSSIEVQQPTVSGNLKKMFDSCLCTSFRSCYCVLTEKIDKNGSVVTIDQFSRLRVGSLRLLRRLECVAWRIVASHCAKHLHTNLYSKSDYHLIHFRFLLCSSHQIKKRR